MTAKTAINRQDLAALAAAYKFTDKRRPDLAVVRVKLDADGLHVQASDSFRMFGYKNGATYTEPDAVFDVCVNAKALTAAVKGRSLLSLRVEDGALVVTDTCGSSSSVPCEDVRRFNATLAIEQSSRQAASCEECDAGRVHLNASYLQEGATALKSIFGKASEILLDAHGGPSSPVSLVARSSDCEALGCVFTMPVRDSWHAAAASAFIED